MQQIFNLQFSIPRYGGISATRRPACPDGICPRAGSLREKYPYTGF